jgi:general secretion pathway protein M
MKQWWIGLSRRERAAVFAAGAIVLAAALYLLAIEPAARTRARLSAELPRLQAEAAELRALALEAKQLKTRVLAVESPEQTRAAVARLLAEKNIPDAALREADGRVILTVKRADAASWLAWLNEVSSALPLRVSSARVARAGPGLVDAEVALAPAGTK